MDKSKLKKLLTATSALVMLSGLSGTAMGALRTDTNANVTFTNGGGVGLDAAFNNGDNFFFSNAGKTLTTGGAVTIGSIDLNNNAPAAGGFTVAHATTVGPITDSTGNGQVIKIVINDGLTLTLANNAGIGAGNVVIPAGTFDGVGNVVLGSGGGGSTLTINSAGTFGGTINSDANDDGVVNIGAAGVIFNGAVGGGQKLGNLNIGNTFSLRINEDLNAANTNLAGTGRLIIDDGKTLTGAVVANGGAGNGVLEFLGAGVVTGKIGNAAAITQIIASGNGAVDLQGAVIQAQTITVAHAGADVQIAAAAAVTGNVNYTANGQVSLANGATLTGNVTTTSNTAADGTNGGKLVAAQGATVTGNIGAGANRLDTVQVTGAGTLDLTNANGAHYARQFRLHNAGAIVQVAAGGSLTGNAVANGANNGKIYFAGNGSFTGQLGDTAGNALGMVKSSAAGTVQISAGNHKVVEFQAANNGSIFEFADGANITGKIDNAAAGGNTTVNFLGSSTVTGTLGQTAAHAAINLKGGADKTVQFGNTIQATNINIGNAVGAASGTLEMNNAGNIAGIVNFLDNTANGTGKIKISGDANHTIGTVNVAQVATGSGEIEITTAVGNAGGRTITLGKIGDNTAADKYLKKITLQSNANNANILKFVNASDGSHVKDILIGQGGGVVEFNKANGNFKIGTIYTIQPNVGKVSITGKTTFDANTPIFIGEEARPMNQLSVDNVELVLPDGSKVYATTLEAPTNNNGTLTFSGDAIFSAATGAQQIDAINVNGNGKTVKLMKALAVNGVVTVDNGATLELNNNFNAAKIVGKAANQGSLKFTNTAAVTLTALVGDTSNGGNSLSSVEFNGRDVTFASKVEQGTNPFNFTAANAATVTFTANTDLSTAVFNNTSANGVTHTVVINSAATAFNGAKLGENAANGNGFINFQLDDVKNASLTGATIATGANFTTGTPGKGELEFNSANLITANSAGTDVKALAKVTFTESGGIAAGTFAKQVIIAQGKTATLGGRVKSDDFTLANAGSKVMFSDGAIVDSVVKATTANEGLVEFAGSGTLNQNISAAGGNRVAQVLFADDVTKTLTLNADILSVDVKMRKGIVKLAKDVTVTGTTLTAAATTFDLGSQKLNASTLAMSGTNNIAFAATVNGNAVTGGQIVVAQGGTLAYAAGTAINVLAQDAGSLRPTGGATRVFSLIVNNTGTNVTGANSLDIAKVNVTNTNALTEWTSRIDAKGGLELVQEDNALEVLTDVLGSAATQDQKDNLAALTAAATGTDAEKVVAMMSTLVNADGSEKVKGKVAETMDRLTTTTTVTDNIAGTGSAVSNALGARLDNLAGIQQTGTPVQTREVAAAETGISAGEESARYGVWATPFYNQTTQKARKGAAGYKGTTFGGSFGFDTRANDDLIIGAAVTVANSEMKHKNFKSGDKTKVNSLLFSIYGMQQMTDAWFVNGIATFGTNDVKNNEKRVSGLTTYDTVRGNYTSMSFNGEVMFGYGIAMQQVAVTPMVGLRYSRVNDGGYTESGSTTGQNLKVNTKASNKLEAIAGARLSGGTFDVNGMNVTPEVHAFVNQDLIGKTSKPTITLAGAGNLSTKSRKPIRTTFNVGLGVMANYGMMEYGAGYDADIADKRIGHTGTLKIRVNF